MEKENLEKFIKAGKIASEVREASKDIVRVGLSYSEIVDKIEKMIVDKGGGLAFPVNISVNEVAAHYTPVTGMQEFVQDSDMVKIDLGVHIDGFTADTAVTINFDEKNERLVNASNAALEEAIKHVYTGALISDISSAIEKTIKEFGYKPVSNLTGHGIARYNLHTSPTIPNVAFTGNYYLHENEIIAIEPFATNGLGHVKDSDQAMIFSILNPKPVRSQDARKIIEFASQRHGLPFAERWLPFNSLLKARLALRELRERGILHEYNVLKEAGLGLVSQAEHSLIVKDKPIILTK